MTSSSGLRRLMLYHMPSVCSPLTAALTGTERES